MTRRRFSRAPLLRREQPPRSLRWPDPRRGPCERAPTRPPLKFPADGQMRVAFAIGEGVNVIDTAGPWEVFQDAALRRPGRVGSTRSRARPSPSRGAVAWRCSRRTPRRRAAAARRRDPGATRRRGHVARIRHATRRADLVMSVCTGAFVLAETGLLDGKTRRPTTVVGHFESPSRGEARPRPRFVEHEHVATAGGLTSGIDLALRRPALPRPDGAAETAQYMEYESRSRAPYNA